MEATVRPTIEEEVILARFFIIARTKVKTFTKTEACKWVGGRRRLEKLVAEKKIRQTKTGDRQTSMWLCNAEDVLRNAVVPRRYN